MGKVYKNLIIEEMGVGNCPDQHPLLVDNQLIAERMRVGLKTNIMLWSIQEINSLLKQDVNVENISSHLSPWAAALFDFLPNFIKKQLLLDRESDGSVQLSQVSSIPCLWQNSNPEV